MNSHDSQPQLPTWIFIVTDLALIGVAALIGLTSPRPFSSDAMLWMTMCVIVGAAVGLVPVIARYERQKNETLDDRQRALEALARTVHTSAEQISIATGGLHEIAEIAQKNLRHAEHLPQKLQEKIAEFQAQLSAAEDTEKEELERELLSLRTSESERLDTVSQRIAKASAEWAKLETATQQHLTAATEALAKLSRGTADAIGKAQAAAEQALAQARTEAARTIGESSGHATRDIATAKAAALADIETKFTAAVSAAIERATRELGAKLAAPKPEESEPAPAAPAAVEQTESVAPTSATPAEPAAEAAAPTPAKRPRKPRREEPAATARVAETAAVNGGEPAAAPAAPAEPSPVAAAAEPPPVPAEKIAEVAPIAPQTSEPFAGEHKAAEPVAESPAAPAAAPQPAAPAATPRKRNKKSDTPAASAEKTATDEPALALDLDAGGNGSAAGVIERVLTSDGATRLLVTAYIGIGNRLFIRGTGPGLNWDKGVPLQFVSIGKWRWETSDATGPVQFKLYKNDEIECAALGAQTIDPGHQEEVTASF